MVLKEIPALAGGNQMKNLCIGLLLITIAAGCSVPTIFQPTPTPTLTPAPTLTPTPQPARIWISPATPKTLQGGIKFEGQYEVVDSESKADLVVKPTGETRGESSWIFSLVVPFNTVADGIALEEVKRIWQGDQGQTFPSAPILLSPDTLAAFESLWGTAAPDRVKVVNPDEITDALWQERGFGLIPFEQVNPRLKVLNVDGKSPLLTGFDPSRYPLRVDFTVTPITNGSDNPVATVTLPQGNFDPALLTSVLMTGTTALVRSTAERMETKGIDYPGLMIGSILNDADFTHISNEVSFTPNCPKPDPWFINLRFCSNPAYFQLLEKMGVDIVELTGNHLLDYNPDAFLYTLDLYQKQGIKTFGGGVDLLAAREPLIIEHNGNRIAFIGCNPVGPDYVWATDTSPGAAPCDFETMQAKIKELSSNGVLVIATLQDEENYEPMPLAQVRQHLDALSDAGAVVVSGSQAHFPQGFSFRDNGFVHYGLGNLFFDQMDYPVVGTRREFYDKHFFYNGRYINSQLLTGLLEDYAQPRPMTAEERSQFLSEMFAASGL
jgi:hypothetical protein